MTPKKVLVIDDEAGFTKLLKMNLEKTGDYEVRIENNSLKALDAAQEFSPDIVLLDIVMPGMDGGDVAAQFQDDPKLRRVPVVMLTALVSQGETSQGAVAQAGSDPGASKTGQHGSADSQCLEETMKNAG